MRSLPREPNPGEKISASWMRDLVRYVRASTPIPGPGMSKVETPNGTILFPSHKTEKSDPSITDPFKIRRVTSGTEDEYGNIGYTGWEIYLPIGCVSVGSTCDPINLPAVRNANGAAPVEVPGWYRLPAKDFPEMSSDLAEQTWLVSIHVKISSAKKGVDAFESWPRRYFYAEMRADDDSTWTNPITDSSSVGDIFSTVVYSIEYDDESFPSHTHRIKTPIMLTGEANGPFELQYVFEQSDDLWELYKLYVRNKSFSAGGATFASNTLTEVPIDSSAIYLAIHTNTTPYTAEIISYASETHDGETLTVDSQVRSALADSPGDVMIRLYELADGHVITDGRASLANIQIYRE